MLVVDDDGLMRELVAVALADLPLVLRACGSVAEARAALSAQPADLVITDLSMPGESGFDLLDQLAAAPALRGTARIIVMSAVIDAGATARLAGHDVWRRLPKPASVLVLRQSVQQALALPAADGAGAPTATPATAATATPASTPPSVADLAASPRAQVIAEQFAGDAALYDGYLASCRQQFPLDLQAARDAWQRRDAPALRRLAHNLKSVLRMLGHAGAAEAAHAVERAAAAGDWPGATTHWPAVESCLRRVQEDPRAR